MTSLGVYQLSVFLAILVATLATVVAKWRSVLSLLGWNLQRRNKWKRERLRDLAEREEVEQEEDRLEKEVATHHEEKEAPYSPDRLDDWDGYIGFFHPFCNAAGGGERVLWAAIKATQQQYPKAMCVVYTGDVNITIKPTRLQSQRRGSFSEEERQKKEAILDKAEANFNIRLHRPRIHLEFLSSRDWVLASRYPYFTLLGQSLGSLRVAYDAFSLFIPNVFIDTMGYSFVTAFAGLVLPHMPTGAYVHYPTISTDMLGSLDVNTGKGLNAGTGRGWKGYLKKRYWHLFARLYGWTGGQTDVVMTNSSWTQAHIRSLWGPSRARTGKSSAIEVVFPPVSVEEIEKAVKVSEASEPKREKTLLYIAQFRPEKNHELILEAFAELLRGSTTGPRNPAKDAKLVLIGSIRNDNAEDINRVSWLRRRVIALGIEDHVQFICNAPWKQMLDYLGKSSIGVNGMWNEHFGIGVVEYQAAGLICVVNDSGGPKEDIVVEIDGSPTGFHANTAKEYAVAFSKALALSPKEALRMRQRARKSARRFSEEGFARSWVGQLDKLVQINILPLPFRRTHAVSLSEALKQYISNKYDQHPDMFKEDLDIIDRLRTEAVTSLEAHASGVRKLAGYAAQVVWVGGKFPIDIGVEFTWYPSLGFNTQRPVSQNNLRFELANTLFNLAALYSQLGISANRSTSEGLKTAGNYFCQAAGVLVYLRTDIIPDLRSTPPEDMDPMTLESLEQLMLAQAQECSWSMAIKNGYKDALIAKLAAKVSDFYDQAAEFGTRSDIISTEWIHHMTAKHHHFAAAAQYRAACDCLEKRKYGEEVARLKDSVTCVNEALKEARWINKVVSGDLHGLKMKVTEDLKRAEKDNDMIYLQPVPPKSELKTLDRAGMAVAKKPTEISDPATSLGDRGQFGQPLFSKLVPYAVHVAASIYEERKNRLVNSSIIDELEGLTNKLRDLLQSLNLPGSLQALEKPLGLPLSLTSHAEETRQQQGLHKIRRSMHDVESLKGNDVATYKEGVELLRLEAAEDDQARLKHGTERWTRPAGQQAADKLYAQVGEIDGYLKSANSSDELVKNKLKDVEPVLRVLEGTDRDLEEYVPSSRKAVMPPKVEQEARKLRNILNEISRLEGRRRRKVESLRAKAKADDVNTVLLTETARLERKFPMQKIEAVQFEDLFEQRLQRYDDDRIMVQDEQEEQDHIVGQLQEANAAFTSTRRGDTSTREREQALQRLENAYLKFKEILSNLDTGRKFYNDLAKIVTRFRDECREFRYQRRMEAGQIETDLSNAMSSLSIAQSNSLQEQKQRETLRSQYSAKAPHKEPLTAPTPTRVPVSPSPATPGMWSPEMGIKFGGAAPQPPKEGNTHNPAYPNSLLGQMRNTQWDPNQGVRFA